jgi:phosphopentomutase
MRDRSRRRVFLLIMDGVGVGALPDAADYGDDGSATLPNLALALHGLHLPNLEAMGLGRIVPILGVRPVEDPSASFCKMSEVSPGKDSTSGHWELAGCVLERAFPTYPDGFPSEVIEQFEGVAGKPPLGNRAASGTVIIQELGDEHLRTGRPIVYTSADSVFQVAAHEDVVPLEELYRICAGMRELLMGEHMVGRVIARPFVGTTGAFERTRGRKDFSLPPPHDTVLDNAARAGVPTVAVGKVRDIFAGRGIARSVGAKSNGEIMDALMGLVTRPGAGVVVATFVDFDMLWGHRNDADGFSAGLRELDTWLGSFTKAMGADDLLFLTADHGNDPTTPSTDHSREYVPLLARCGVRPGGVDLGDRDSFADVAATAADFLDIAPTDWGTSFLGLLPC